MSPAEAATLVGSVVTIASQGIEAAERLKAWLDGDGERPDDVLPELPSFALNHLEIAAAEARGRKAGTIP